MVPGSREWAEEHIKIVDALQRLEPGFLPHQQWILALQSQAQEYAELMYQNRLRWLNARLKNAFEARARYEEQAELANNDKKNSRTREQWSLEDDIDAREKKSTSRTECVRRNTMEL